VIMWDDSFSQYSDTLDAVPILSDQFLVENYLKSPDNQADISIDAHSAHESISPFPFYQRPEDKDRYIRHTYKYKQLSFNMNIDKCTKFSGLSTENPHHFLSEFLSVVELYNLDDVHNDRRTAAFHLLLTGPARIWFNALCPDDKSSWALLLKQFKLKYISLDVSHPTLVLETEQFNNMTLSPGEPLELFHSRLFEKANHLGKSDAEVLHRFVSCLPQQLAFFVRAGSPASSSEALASAKMGECAGYRQHLKTVSALYPDQTSGSASNIEVQQLKQQISTLTDAVNKLTLNSSDKQQQSSTQYHVPQHFPDNENLLTCDIREIKQNICDLATTISQIPSVSSASKPVEIKCFLCMGIGHMKHVCNWNNHGVSSPSVKCQLCSQFGHTSLFCKTLAGNWKAPGFQRHSFLGH